ncbi:MAG: niacin transporter [Clostridiales bacterium]|nr:niacin transporter [Clostridiales bacterium]
MNRNRLVKMVTAAMLIAVSIAIPMFSPFKIILEPASFTLASHVAIFIAMFISPAVAISVAAGATLGFLLGGFPIVIVLRAASHLIFVAIGAILLQKRPQLMENKVKLIGFAFIISVIHAVSEVLVVMPFYFGSSMPEGYYARGFLLTVIGLVGVGTVVHSLVDFAIARAVWAAVRKASGKSIVAGSTVGNS